MKKWLIKSEEQELKYYRKCKQTVQNESSLTEQTLHVENLLKKTWKN